MTYSSRTALQEATERAEFTRIPVEAVLPFVQKELADHPFLVRYAELSSLELMSVVRYDDPPATHITFNMRHPYVLNVMLDERITPRALLSAVEVTLMIVHGVGQPFDERYVSEAHEWSERLYHAATILTRYDRDGYNMLGLPEDHWTPDDEDVPE